MKTSIKLLLPLVAVSFTSLASVTAAANTATDVPSITVQYDAARLATRAGVRELHSRLFMAARSVCKQLDSRVLGLREQYDQCVRDSIRRSVGDVGNENLSSFHRHGVMPRALAAS
jgi:UrcA family protein